MDPPMLMAPESRLSEFPVDSDITLGALRYISTSPIAIPAAGVVPAANSSLWVGVDTPRPILFAGLRSVTLSSIWDQPEIPAFVFLTLES